MDLPIKVIAIYKGMEVTGYLTGNGAGSYTGLRSPSTGQVISVKKSTVKQLGDRHDT
jgi:hypothetical protein